MGRSPVREIEVILNYKPQHFEIWDPREWKYVTLPDGRIAIKVPSLYAKEFFTISIIDTIGNIPDVISVRSLEGRGKAVAMAPQRIFPNWISYCLAIILFVGFVTIVYFVLQLILRIT